MIKAIINSILFIAIIVIFVNLSNDKVLETSQLHLQQTPTGNLEKLSIEFIKNISNN